MTPTTTLLRSFLGAMAMTAVACGSDATSGSTTSGVASSSAAPASSATNAKAVPLASQAPVASASAAPKKPAPKWWKPEWGPYLSMDGAGSEVVSFVPDKVTAKGMPDFAKCEIDGPFAPGGASVYGAPCSDDIIQGCFEVAHALYQRGRWTCGKAVHEFACKHAPNLTKPPKDGSDSPQAGLPQCPADKVMAERDKELADPTMKACYVEHKSAACAELAMKLKEDDTRRLYLLAVAEAWDK